VTGCRPDIHKNLGGNRNKGRWGQRPLQTQSPEKAKSRQTPQAAPQTKESNLASGRPGRSPLRRFPRKTSP
jgi:hypothetical protein